jgi:hypothetical protein
MPLRKQSSRIGWHQLFTRFVEGANFSSKSAGRTGLRTSSPLQFGQVPANLSLAQSQQNVHSKLQIMASAD